MKKLLSSEISLIIIIFIISQAHPSILKRHKPIRTNIGRTELEESMLGIHFLVNTQHFINGRLKVTFLISRPFPSLSHSFCYEINWMGNFFLLMLFNLRGCPFSSTPQYLIIVNCCSLQFITWEISFSNFPPENHFTTFFMLFICVRLLFSHNKTDILMACSNSN